MKKLFRMALVLALAGSALLYTSCTKDYSPDIKSLQDQINQLGSDTDGLGWVKSQLQNVQSALSSLSGKDTELDGKISNLDGKITNAVNTINSALEGKADKAEVNAALADINADIQDLKDILEGTEDAIGLIEKLEAASQSIDSLLGYADFIQSIAYVPATTDGKITVIPYQLTNKGQGEIEVFDHYEYEFNVPTQRLPRAIRTWTPQQAYDYSVINFITGQVTYPYRQYVDREEVYVKTTNSQPLLVASFKVTPAEAAARATESSARLVAVQTKAAAAAPDTLTITKLVQRDDAPGYVDVYAIPGKVKFDPQTFAVALAVTQVTDSGLTESVTSDYAPAEIQADAESIVFEIRDNEDGTIVDPSKEDTPVEVTPSSDPDSVNVFTAGRWSVVASFADSYLTPEEAKEVFGVKDIALVSPLPGDTIVKAVAQSSYYEWEDYGFESTVWPAGDYKIKDLVNSSNDQFQLKLYLANTHMVGSAEESGEVVATYQAAPDKVKLALTPEHPVVIPWDYKYYNNINDTLIAKIWVAGDRNKLIGNGDQPLGKATKTWNKESEVDYTEGLGDVTPHTNDSKAIDVVLRSAAEYGKIDSTYVYSIQQYNADECVMYTGEFDYVVEARPADVKVELGPVDTMVCFASDIVFDVEPIYKAIAAHADAYAPFDTADVYPAFAAAVGNGNPKAGKATLDGKELKNYGAALNIVYSDKPEDASTLTAKINKVGKYEIPFEYKVFGIKYTFVLTVNAQNNPAKIAPKAAYVTVDNEETKDYSVEVKGDVDTTAGAANRYHYYLNDMPLKDYIKVVDYAESSETLMIGNKIATAEAVGLVQNPPSATKLDRLEEAPTVANLHDNRNYKWYNYDSLQFKIAVVLYPEADASAQIDSATVRLWTKNPIPVFDGGDMLVVEHEKDQLASANIAANLNIKDLNGVALNDSTGLRAIGWDAKAKEVVVDYDQALSYEDDFTKFKLISGADNISELLLSWDEDKPGVLNLQLNQGTIVTPIIIQVPVYLSHMLDRGMEDELVAWVTVKFVEKGSASAQ